VLNLAWGVELEHVLVTMSDLVRYNWVFLAPLITQQAHPLFHEILTQLSDNQIKALCEIAVNTFYGVIPISKLHKNRLILYKDLFENLSKKKVLTKKRALLLEHPEFITLLLKAVQKHLITDLLKQ
jgi:hypothetical protein